MNFYFNIKALIRATPVVVIVMKLLGTVKCSNLGLI